MAVAGLSADGRLEVPNSERIWIEVGCNNWEMLRDQLPDRGGVHLITFEPLVDKFAFIHSLARADTWHTVLPFAVAPPDLDHFVALRSQNYTDFRGMAGRAFRESGASSLLPYAEGFQDHWWPQAPTQYRFFREYLVPTVSLEWVLGSLLMDREVDFLKVDAQGLDYGAFASLGRHMQKVRRVQMELHTHVRHHGELACADVIARMAQLHGFAVERGSCAVLDPTKHDEVDVVFKRL